MNRLTLILLLFVTPALATTYTEFYATGTPTNNLNAGSTTNDGPIFHGTVGYFTNTTGWWKSSTPVDLSGVTSNMWASIYTNGCTTNVFVAYITNVSDADDTIAVSLSAKAGTAPSNDTAGFTEIRVGGAWKGPTQDGVNIYDDGFPFPFVSKSLTNPVGNVPRINIRGISTCVSDITQGGAGPLVFEGYSSTPQDGGFWTNNTTASINIAGGNVTCRNFIFDGTGASGVATMISATGGETLLYRVVARNATRSGIAASATAVFVECEAYNCNVANAAVANIGGFQASAGTVTYLRCFSHNNTGTRGDGFWMGTVIFTMLDCISANNGTNGLRTTSTTSGTIKNCDFYNNAGSGIELLGASAAQFSILGCNFFGNDAWGINSSGSSIRNGLLQNNSFGSGTQTNGSGSLADNMNSVLGGLHEQGTILYTANETPYVSASTGNFSLDSNANTLGKGSGSFVTWSTNSFIVAYPDIGAVQRASTNSGGSTIIHRAIFAQ